MNQLSATYQHPQLGKLSIAFRTDRNGVVAGITIHQQRRVISLTYREMTKRYDCYSSFNFDKQPFIDFANSAELNAVYLRQLATCPCCQKQMRVFTQKSPFTGRPDVTLADCQNSACNLWLATLSLGEHHQLTPEAIEGYGRARKRQQAAV